MYVCMCVCGCVCVCARCARCGVHQVTGIALGGYSEGNRTSNAFIKRGIAPDAKVAFLDIKGLSLYYDIPKFSDILEIPYGTGE